MAMPRLSLLLLTLGSASLIGPRPAASQSLAGVTAGAILPAFGSMVQQYGQVNGVAVTRPVLEKWMAGGPALTSRGIFRLTGRLDFEAAVVYSRGMIATRDSLNNIADLHGNLVIASIRTPVMITPRGNMQLYFAPGIAYSIRGGKAWRGFSHLDAPGAVLALGFRTPLHQRSRFWIQWNVEDYITWSQFAVNRRALNPRGFHMGMMSLGVMYQLGN